MIGLVTDSNTMLPDWLRRLFDIVVVPLTIVVDGVPTREDAVDPAEFFAALRSGIAVSTSAPPPGEMLAAYEAIAEAGATEILSVHIGSGYSAVVNSAHVAAGMLDIPVHVVDTGQASFAAGMAVWSAGQALSAGCTARDAIAAATRTAAEVASVFTIAEVARAEQGGRLSVRTSDDDGVPVVSMAGAQIVELGRAHSVDDAVDMMVRHVASLEGDHRVAVGGADAEPAAAALTTRLTALPIVPEIVRYDVGPSVAAHTGAGTFGAVFVPLRPAP